VTVERVGVVELHADKCVTVWNYGGNEGQTMVVDYPSELAWHQGKGWAGKYSYWNPWDK
jgi:hypothetical protein